MSIKDKFKNKTQMKAFVGELLRGSEIGEITNKNDVFFLNELLTNYREKEKEKRKILRFSVGLNKYNQNHFMYSYLLDRGGVEFDSFSYTKAIDCIYGKRITNKDKFKSAMRKTLEDDFKQFRASWLKVMPYCELSGDKMTSNSCHVDHHGEMEFRHIIDSFCELNKIDYDSVNYTSTLNGDVCADHEIIKMFRLYHDKKCKLRVVTAKENLKRGKL